MKTKLDHESGWNNPAVVIATANNPRSYIVETDNGKQLRRNRRHIQAQTPTDPPDTPETVVNERLTTNPSDPTEATVTTDTGTPTRKSSRAIKPTDRYGDWIT